MHQVWNIRDPKKPKDVINVSRQGILGGLLGNPYTHIQDRRTNAEFIVRDRDEACDKFELYFEDRMANDPVFAAAVESLRGHDLECFCAPARCHATTYARYLDGTTPSDAKGGQGA